MEVGCIEKCSKFNRICLELQRGQVSKNNKKPKNTQKDSKLGICKEQIESQNMGNNTDNGIYAGKYKRIDKE